MTSTFQLFSALNIQDRSSSHTSPHANKKQKKKKMSSRTTESEAEKSSNADHNRQGLWPRSWVLFSFYFLSSDHIIASNYLPPLFLPLQYPSRQRRRAKKPSGWLCWAARRHCVFLNSKSILIKKTLSFLKSFSQNLMVLEGNRQEKKRCD